ncbi:Biotin-protein ligase [Georgfuchsia toluolica]|uniref:biotin--[biotin carboxyl-carrier protein] ligase n=1 Tax=Georgfuchsia toluolica TaxID=424218 RepID=A0A916J6X9_9PROT|nr:biotin--[acetyl-CoA-carboxylase] ligase [Georgfuchsia toluolica]CAG4884563.1 Biotin-protein ligase [Georgfuchsia toluolica]
MPSPTFDVAACAAALGAEAAAFSLNAVAECDSTNTQLMRQAEAGAPSATVIVADRQSAGRGRRERVWLSSPLHSLTFSLLWRFAAGSSAPEALSLAVGLGLQRALAAAGATAAVKWPNDILCRGRKLAGVLIEVQPGDIKSAIIGIGINLRLPPDMPAAIADNAIALDEVLPQSPTRERLLAVLLSELAATLHRYQSEGFAGLRDEWQARHVFQGSNVRIMGGGEDIEGICSGVTDRGELLIKTEKGTQRVITGDVSLRPT